MSDPAIITRLRRALKVLDDGEPGEALDMLVRLTNDTGVQLPPAVQKAVDAAHDALFFKPRDEGEARLQIDEALRVLG